MTTTENYLFFRTLQFCIAHIIYCTKKHSPRFFAQKKKSSGKNVYMLKNKIKVELQNANLLSSRSIRFRDKHHQIDL